MPTHAAQPTAVALVAALAVLARSAGAQPPPPPADDARAAAPTTPKAPSAAPAGSAAGGAEPRTEMSSPAALGVGIALATIGGATAGLGTALAVAGGNDDGPFADGFVAIGALGIATGAVLALVGVPLIVAGAEQEPVSEADAPQRDRSMRPSITVGATSASASWHF